MEWPKELLEIFNDPIFADVRPKSTPLTANDRMLQKLAEVKDWIANNGREPREDGNLKEKMMCAAMKALKEKGVEV
jgi:hypothetical protein